MIKSGNTPGKTVGKMTLGHFAMWTVTLVQIGLFSGIILAAGDVITYIRQTNAPDHATSLAILSVCLGSTALLTLSLSLVSALASWVPVHRFWRHGLNITTAFILMAPLATVVSTLMRYPGPLLLVSAAVGVITVLPTFWLFDRMAPSAPFRLLAATLASCFSLYLLNSDYAIYRASAVTLNPFFIYVHALCVLPAIVTIAIVILQRTAAGAPLSRWLSIPMGIVALFTLMWVLQEYETSLATLKFPLQLLCVIGLLIGTGAIPPLKHVAVAVATLSVLSIGGLATFIVVPIFADNGEALISNTVTTSAVLQTTRLLAKPENPTIKAWSHNAPYKQGLNTLATAHAWNKRPPRPANNWSVILITIDSTRYDVLKRYHPNTPTYTPNLDALAKRSYLFTTTYAQGGWTTISIPSINWGKYPRLLRYTPMYEDDHYQMHLSAMPPPGRVMRYRFQTPIKEPDDNLAAILGKAGYRTVASVCDGGGNMFNPRLGMTRHYQENRYPKEIIKRTKTKKHQDDVGAAQIVNLIKEQENRTQPFFAWLHLMSPHALYTPPKGYGIPFTGYKGEVYFADMLVGRIIKQLAASKQEQNTVVIVTADHGEGMGEHHIKYHGNHLYDELTRVPLIIHLPGQQDTTVIEEPAALVDLAPTIVDLVGLPIPESMQGVTLTPIMAGRRKHPPIFLETWRYRARTFERYLHYTGVVDGDYKLIWNQMSDAIALFNLKRDPAEKKNLVRKNQTPKSKKALFRLGGLLKGWMAISR